VNSFTFQANSEADTERLGAALAELLPGGTTIALCGTLGAGKTRLVQALAVGLGIAREDVTSPTFILCRPYEGQRMLYHLDAYRLRDDDEFLELGPEEFFYSEGITVVEWGDRVASCLPTDYIKIQIEVTGDCTRIMKVLPVGDRYLSVVAVLSSRLREAASG